jgi:hypothetical protein
MHVPQGRQLIVDEAVTPALQPPESGVSVGGEGELAKGERLILETQRRRSLSRCSLRPEGRAGREKSDGGKTAADSLSTKDIS